MNNWANSNSSVTSTLLDKMPLMVFLFWEEWSAFLINDIQKTCSTIKSVHHSSWNKNTIKVILLNNVEVTDDYDIAQLFNNFFTGIATELEADIPASNLDPLSLVSIVHASVFLSPVSVEECANLISKLKNTETGFNQLPVKFYNYL